MKGKFDNVLSAAFKGLEATKRSIKDRIVISPKFKEFIPPLSKEELQQLEENIIEEGVRDPLILWPVGEEYILVDGHNRFEICKKNNLDFPFKELNFENEDGVLEWMAKNQLGRRNLTPEQISYFRGKRYLQERGKVGENVKGQNDPSHQGNTSERLAIEYSVSPKTIKRDALFAKGLDVIGEQAPDLRNEILQSKSNITKKEIELISKDPSKVSEVISQKAKEDSKEISAGINPVPKIPAIALSYAQLEKRDFNEVVTSLNLKIDSLNPQDFFIAWYNSRQ